jgi:subtilisin family serine protease
MSKLPATGAILAIAVLVAAAPAAQGRRVLVAVERDAHSPAGGAFVGKLPDREPMYAIKVPRGRDPRAFSQQLRMRRGVIAAQPIHRLRLAQQSPVGCVPRPDQPINRIATDTNSLLVDQAATKPIAILDTGVDPGVAEIQGRVLPALEATGSGSSKNLADPDGHGTEVAAVAAASPGLVRGVSPVSQILPVRIFNVTGETSSDIVVKGIGQAVQAGAGVINISAAGALSDATANDKQVLTVAIAQAFNAGVLTVAPMGNEGKSQPDVPGAYPHVLTVGSGTVGGGRDLFSNTGPWIDLLAPGSGLTLPTASGVCESGYAQVNGTSFASPAVAGAVALLQAAKPGIAPQQLFDVVQHAAIDVGATGWDSDSGFGFLDVLDSVSGVLPPKLGNEIDDDIMFAKLKPVIPLKLGKSKLIQDSESAAKDNTDVFRITLKKGEGISANIANKDSNALFSVSLLNRTAGPLDMTNDVTKHVLKDSGGLSPTPFFTARVKKTGTYYVAVETPDPLQDDIDDTTPTDQPYTLKLKRQKPLKKHKKKSSAKKPTTKKH